MRLQKIAKDLHVEAGIINFKPEIYVGTTRERIKHVRDLYKNWGAKGIDVPAMLLDEMEIPVEYKGLFERDFLYLKNNLIKK